MVASAVGGAAIVGGVVSSQNSKSAANKASDAQQQASQDSIAEQQRQFDIVQGLLKPYADAGTGSIDAQKSLLGLNGAQAQQSAYDQLKQSPAYTSSLQSGTNAILQNAAATGGLRGGNTQSALGTYGGNLLAGLAQNQFANLGQLTNIGQNAAAGTGSAALATGNNISSAYNQIGAAQAGNAIAQGNANNQLVNSTLGGFGAFLGAGGTKYF